MSWHGWGFFDETRSGTLVDDEWFMLIKEIIALPVPLIHAAWNETKTATTACLNVSEWLNSIP